MKRSNNLPETYVGLGWPIVPCREKRGPRGDWSSKTLNRPERIATHLGKGGTLGLLLGPGSNLVDVEADGEQAEADVQELFGGEVPITPSWQSRRGKHRLFRYDSRLAESGSSVLHHGAAEIRTGANCKATMSLLPPSEVDGHRRDWLPGCGPEVEPAELPPAVVDKLLTGSKTSAPKAEHNGETIPTGERNQTLFKLASAMRRQGASEGMILSALGAMNQFCQPSLPAGELRDIAASVGKYKPSDSTEAKPTGPVGFLPDPWNKAVSGKALFADVVAFIRRYIVLPEQTAVVVAAWIMAAWAVDSVDHFPHLAVTSPAKRCGKTRLLSVLELLLPKPLFAASISPAALYRVIQQDRPTLLIDEAQSLQRRGSEASEVLRELLCAGINRQARVFRCGGPNGQELEAFPIFCPKAVALIGSLDDVLGDRCISVRMERKQSGENVQPWRSKVAGAEALPLARKLCRWIQDNQGAVEEVYQGIESFPLANDRLAELLLPLQAVVQVADAKMMGTLRDFALGADETDPACESPGIRLLGALREIFLASGKAFLPTGTVIQELIRRTEEPWGRWKGGSSITAHALGDLLRPFRVSSERAADQSCRGYSLSSLEPAWGRYLTPGKASNPSKASGTQGGERPTKPRKRGEKRRKRGK